MSLKIGIVGLPNVGKSTLFNALLGASQAAASNFPFCTIEPNTGTVPIPDKRLDKLAEIEKSKQIVPATVEFVDIAGLVKGASQGQGLGNQFLSHIREVDAIVMVVRLFVDENVTHISGNIHPEEDIKIINTELLLADLQTLEQRLSKEEKLAKTNPKLQPKVSFYKKVKQHLDEGCNARTISTTDDEKIFLKELQLFTAKPIMYVANVDDSQIKDPNALKPLEAILIKDKAQVLSINAKTEAELIDLQPNEKKEYLDELGLTEPSLNKVIQAGYKLLNLITFFTAGLKEARGWTITNGSDARTAAGVIHTDFAKGFIRAETVSYDDFVEYNGWSGAGKAGKIRSEGKNYIVKDGDVMLFRFNV